VVRDARVGEPVAAIEDRLPDVILVRGTTVHINQIKHGRVGDRYTGVVITDDGDHLVLQAVWLHENDLGVARIEPGDVATEHYWRSRFFSIWEVHGPAGLHGWYCNVARPAVLVAGHPELAAEARRAARFLSELTPQRLQELLASSPTALVGRHCHDRPT
jgi:hypothetical protein